MVTCFCCFQEHSKLFRLIKFSSKRKQLILVLEWEKLLEKEVLFSRTFQGTWNRIKFRRNHDLPFRWYWGNSYSYFPFPFWCLDCQLGTWTILTVTFWNHGSWLDWPVISLRQISTMWQRSRSIGWTNIVHPIAPPWILSRSCPSGLSILLEILLFDFPRWRFYPQRQKIWNWDFFSLELSHFPFIPSEN